MERKNKSLQVYFRCKYCHQTFSTPESLINHKLTTHAAEVLTIRPEAAVFAASAVEHPLRDVQELHAGTRHKNEDNVVQGYKPSCRTSEAANDAIEKDESGAERHQEKRTQETPFSCMYCFKNFSQCAALNSHMIQCESTWVDENVLEDHTGDNATQAKIYRRNGPSPTTTGSITAAVRNRNVSKWILKNSLVNEPMSRVDSEHDHRTKQEESFFQTDDEEPESRQLNSTQEACSEMQKGRGREHETRYHCKYCDHSSIHRTYMLNHEKAHTLERSFKCPWCSKSYIRSSHLTRHKPNCKGRTMQRISSRMKIKSTQPSETVDDRNEGTNTVDQKEGDSTRRDLSVHRPVYQSEIQAVPSVSIGDKSVPVQCQLCNKHFRNRFLAADHQKFHSDGHHERSCCDISRVSDRRRATISNASSAVMELHGNATIRLSGSTNYIPTAKGNHPTNNSPKMVDTQHYPISMPKPLQPRGFQIKPGNQVQIFKKRRGQQHVEDSWYPHIKRYYSKQGYVYFSCNLCGKIITKRADAIRHTGTHLGSDIHFCPHCPEKFPKRDLLVSHLAVHGEEML